MDKINLNGIKVYGYHGAIDAERVLGQYFIADVILHLDLTEAGNTDDLSATVHYGEAYDIIVDVMKSEPVNLIEHLAQKVISALFDAYDKIDEITITLTKPHPPIDGHYDNVSVTLHRER